jgi:hypothetical protein
LEATRRADNLGLEVVLSLSGFPRTRFVNLFRDWSATVVQNWLIVERKLEFAIGCANLLSGVTSPQISIVLRMEYTSTFTSTHLGMLTLKDFMLSEIRHNLVVLREEAEI